MRMSAAEQRERAVAAQRERLAQLSAKAGFLRVWRALKASAKPLVGHNLLCAAAPAAASAGRASPRSEVRW